MKSPMVRSPRRQPRQPVADRDIVSADVLQPLPTHACQWRDDERLVAGRTDFGELADQEVALVPFGVLAGEQQSVELGSGLVLRDDLAPQPVDAARETR